MVEVIEKYRRTDAKHDQTSGMRRMIMDSTGHKQMLMADQR